MAANDMGTMALPQAALETLAGRTAASVLDQRIVVNFGWWNSHLVQAGLGELPTDDRNADSLTRAQIFTLARETDGDPDAALGLLWASVAWGAGSRRRLCVKRMRAVAEDPVGVGKLLSSATAASKVDPEEAYAMLRGSGRSASAVKYLGPAFFTKFLYFAGGGNATHPCLILDARVAASLVTLGWRGLRKTGWTAATYRAYVDLLHRWAGEASENDSIGRAVRPDELELWLFAQ